jgi:hypothetical protein
MGFPLIMYLSRSKTVSLWPNLELEQHGARSRYFQGAKSELSLSLNPKVSISAEWKKPESKPPPLRTTDAHWPPPWSEEIVQALEALLVEKNELGTMTEFLARKFDRLAYKLCGTFTLDDQSSSPDWRDIGLEFHGLYGRLQLADSGHAVALILALDNVAGIDERDGRWRVWESGAMHFLREARTGGYPLMGLFTYEGAHRACFANCGAVYFANYVAYKRLKRGRWNDSPWLHGDRLRDIYKTLERGFPTMPELPEWEP